VRSPFDINIQQKPGDALFDAYSGFVEADMLLEDFDILYFLDFCAALEAAVLHENLHHIRPVGPTDPNEPEELKEHAIAAALLKENVLHAHSIPKDPLMNEVERNPRTKSLLSAAFQGIKTTDEDIKQDADYWSAHMGLAMAMSRFVLMEDITELPVALGYQYMPMYIGLAGVIDEQRNSKKLLGILAQKYGEVRIALTEMREQSESADFVHLPPIAFEILSKARSYKEIPQVLLETRHRYRDLRKRFQTLEETLRDDDVPLKTKMQEKLKLFRAINHFDTNLKKEKAIVATSFARGLNENLKVEKLVDGVGGGDVNWTKLVALLIDQAESLFWRFRLRPLYATKNRYLEASSKDFGRVIQKHFRHELTPVEIATADRKMAFVNSRVKRFEDA
jgi:hypothetical protein